MYDGSIVELDGSMFERVGGQWVFLALDPEVWYPDDWMMRRNFNVIKETTANPLSDLEVGSIVTGPKNYEVAVYSGDGKWFLTGFGDWLSPDELLEFFGDGWKVIYKAGDNDA